MIRALILPAERNATQKTNFIFVCLTLTRNRNYFSLWKNAALATFIRKISLITNYQCLHIRIQRIVHYVVFLETRVTRIFCLPEEFSLSF